MSHTSVKHDILRALNRIPGVRFWDNPVGSGWTESGQHVDFGLSRGSSDLIGIVDGRFVGLEVKTGTGRERKEQTLFRNTINQLGGHATVVHSVDEALDAIAKLRAAA